jgi:PTH2 family peptidyl-tRNA hydrolase
LIDKNQILGVEIVNCRFKQAILIRSDLKMGKGKLAVQVAHAAVAASDRARLQEANWWRSWMNEGQCKVALKVTDQDELIRLKVLAEKKGLPTYLVEDRGLTQIPPGSITCLGIGPGPADQIDVITGELSLM